MHKRDMFFRPTLAIISGRHCWYRSKEGWWQLSYFGASADEWNVGKRYTFRWFHKFVKHCRFWQINLYKVDTGQVW